MKYLSVHFDGGRFVSRTIANTRLLVTRSWGFRTGERVVVQGFDRGDLEELSRGLLATESFRRPESEDDQYRDHGWRLEVSFWDGRILGRRGSPRGSYEVQGALLKWLSTFKEVKGRTPTICDTGPPDAPVADETDAVAEVSLDSPVSRRALEGLTPLVMRSGAPARRADGSTVVAALDRRATFSLPSGLVTDPSWLYWGISWRFHESDAPWAWGIMRVAKAGGRPELTVAFEDPTAALRPHADHHGYRLLGVDDTRYYLGENVGGRCNLLWQVSSLSPARSAIRHFAYWFNADRHGFYTFEDDRVMRRAAGQRIDLGPRFDLGPLSGHHPTSDGRYLYGHGTEGIWRVALEGGKRIRLAPMRRDVPTESPLKLDARWLYFYRYSSGPTYYFFRAPKSGGNTERLFPIGPAAPADLVVTDRWICWCGQGAALGVYCGDKAHGPASRVSASRCAAIAADDRWVYWLDDLERVVAKRPLPGP